MSDMDEATRKLLKDKKFLRLMRKLCPDGKGCTSVTLSSSRGQSVTLTPETRAQITERLKRVKG